MNDSAAVRLDRELCSGCLLCVTVCPSRTFAMDQGKAKVAGPACIGCCQCQAVCPEGAIRVDGFDGWAEAYASFAMDDTCLKPGDYPLAPLVALMRSRRSVRAYADRPVPLKVLEDLVRIGVTAPSGTNAQKWTFTLVPDRQGVLGFGREVARFFTKLNKLAANPAARLLTRLIGQGALTDYYRDHYRSVAQALAEWEETGADRLFHGAPAAIVIGSSPGASCPGEDALLATQNILLAAQAMGLGTCLIGYAVEAMRHDRRIARALGIPKEEQTYAVIALGYPKLRYARLSRRRRPLIRLAAKGTAGP